MTKQESYYDWELALRTKSFHKKKKNEIPIKNLDISQNEFKKFIKLWKSKNKVP